MNRIFELLKKYKGIISYLFFGVCTTLIDVSVYFLCYNIIQIENVPSTVIAWLGAVMFAFITNKLFVFESKSFSVGVLCREALSFFGCRILTGLLDVGVMYFSVDIMQWNSTVWKLISNVLVVVFNYIASKLIIFRKKKA